MGRFPGDDRGVSSALGYILNLGVLTLVLTSVFVAGTTITQERSTIAIENDLQESGEGLALGLQRVDHLVRSTESTGPIGTTTELQPKAGVRDYRLRTVGTVFAWSDDLVEFEETFTREDNGLGKWQQRTSSGSPADFGRHVRAEGDSTGSPTGEATYNYSLPSNDGEMTLAYDVYLETFEGSEFAVYAEDAGGTRHDFLDVDVDQSNAGFSERRRGTTTVDAGSELETLYVEFALRDEAPSDGPGSDYVRLDRLMLARGPVAPLSCTGSCVLAETNDGEFSATVPFDTETPVESTAVGGGRVRIVRDRGEDYISIEGA
jgi:hypothetical protein